MIPRRAVLASVEASARRLGESGRWLLALPSSYVAGVQVIVRSLVAGHEPFVVDGLDIGRAAASDHTDTPAFVSLVPTQLHRIMGDAEQLAALARCHTVLVGGGGLDRDLRRRAEEHGVHVVSTYGSSETAGGCVYDGMPLDGVAVSLGAEGRVAIAGPVLFSHYDADPELTAETLVDGWFLTSDAGRFDEDGRLQILGRIDDVVISGGVKIPRRRGRRAAAAAPARRAGRGLRTARPGVGSAAGRGRRGLRRGTRAPRLGQHGAPPVVGSPRVRVGRQRCRCCRTARWTGRPSRPACDPLVPVHVFSIPLRTRFRGITVREGVLLRGDAGWGEWSPFLEYDDATSRPWLACAREAADEGWPEPLRQHVPVNVTVPATDPAAGPRDRRRRRLPHREGQGRRARPDPRRRPGPHRGGARRAGTGRPRSGSTPTAPGTSTRRSAPSPRSTGPPADWSTSSSRSSRSRTSPSYAVGSTCRSPPTSRSGGPRTPTGSATSRPPTSPC